MKKTQQQIIEQALRQGRQEGFISDQRIGRLQGYEIATTKYVQNLSASLNINQLDAMYLLNVTHQDSYNQIKRIISEKL